MPDLDALFWPESIVLVGASPDKHGIRGRIVDAVRQHGFTGPIYPISRSHESIDGLPAYRTVGDIPESADLAIVTIPAEYVADALEACGARGVRAAGGAAPNWRGASYHPHDRDWKHPPSHMRITNVFRAFRFPAGNKHFRTFP